MNRNIIFTPGEFYHLYNRGVDKRNVFMTPSDYERFVLLLFACNDKAPLHINNKNKTQRELLCSYKRESQNSLINIGTYCLMPNHFHILVRETDDYNISKFMQKLSTGYTMYFNKKYVRTGALFQGKFKAKHITNDRYLKYIFSYIHLNPVKLIEPEWKEKGINNTRMVKRYLKNYKYSGYLDYIGETRVERKILNVKILSTYFSPDNSFETNVTEWLTHQNDLQ